MFNYFSVDGIDRFTFYRLPKVLVIGDEFKELSCEAKIFYGLLIDRASVSKRNQWVDNDKHIYVYFKLDELMEMLNIGKNKAVSVFKELDDIGLILRKKQGQGKPTKIYVMNFSETVEAVEDADLEVNAQTSDLNTKKEVQTPKKQTSEKKLQVQEVQTSQNQTSEGLNTGSLPSYYMNKTEMSKNNLSFLPSEQTGSQESNLSNKTHSNGMNEEKEYTTVEKKVKEQIEYEYLLNSAGINENTLNLIVSLIADVYLHRVKKLLIEGIEIPDYQIIREYEKLDESHIEYIFDCLKEQSKQSQIKNIRKYLRVCLYNAPHTMDMQYEQMIDYDFEHIFNNRNQIKSVSDTTSAPVGQKSESEVFIDTVFDCEYNQQFNTDNQLTSAPVGQKSKNGGI